MRIIYFFKKAKFKFTFLIFLFIISVSAFAQKPLTITKDFNLFTSDNLQGYLKPLFTSVEESFNSDIFTKAVYPNYFTIAIDISAMGMFIPESQKTFDALLPEGYGDPGLAEQAYMKDGVLYKTNIKGTIKEPTIFGGSAQSIFSAPQNNYPPGSWYKSVGFAEGNNVGFMSGVPVLQLIAGLPTRTQIRFRYLPIPVSGETMTYYGIMLNQQINQFFGLFADDPDMGLALNLAYHKMSRNQGISVSSMAFGAHLSKTWDEWLTAYGGFQIETLSGSFEAVRDTTGASSSETLDNPYAEVRNRLPLKFDINGFNSFRILGGLSIKTGILEIHGDIAYASQPILTCGLTFWLFSIGKPQETVKVQKYERIEKIERIETKEIYKEKETIKEKEVEREKVKESEKTDSTKTILKVPADTVKPKIPVDTTKPSIPPPPPQSGQPQQPAVPPQPPKVAQPVVPVQPLPDANKTQEITKPQTDTVPAVPPGLPQQTVPTKKQF